MGWGPRLQLAPRCRLGGGCCCGVGTGQPQGLALGDEQAEVLPAAEWMQQRTAMAGCDCLPQTASVQLRTAGRSS